jgi:multiple sugar transport system permease protein
MRRAFRLAVVHGLLIFGALLTLAPLVWMLMISVTPVEDGGGAALGRLPQRLTWAHYRSLFAGLDLGRALFNSAFVATAVTVIALFLNSMAGYAFAKLEFGGRDRLLRLLLGALVIPAQVSMLPLFLMLKELGLVNTYAGVIIPGMASIFGIFLVRQYALSIPDGILDAARIDGAGEFRMYWSLALPACRPILATLALFTFQGTWNDFMWPLIVLMDDDMHTLPVALANLVGEHSQDPELMMAGAVLAVLPVVTLFVAFQRHYIAGIMSGALKD